MHAEGPKFKSAREAGPGRAGIRPVWPVAYKTRSPGPGVAAARMLLAVLGLWPSLEEPLLETRI